MSSDSPIAIRATALGKCYHIYARPADRLRQFLAPRLAQLAGRMPRAYHREFWALGNVTFDIRQGETVGIIGRNGSGKSTLLQMICGTLTPTTGTVETQGRVAALLELGAGFNPEYTGRENVYMNCAVLGLTRAQVDERLDSILDFSEIRDFIDQPVKTYSSGMFARLAFAAAIHVEPDVLIVDEALSVGDFAFQYKCLQKLRDLAARGCAVLFVTHDIEQVQKLCSRALYLKQGRVEYFGDAMLACNRYLADLNAGQAASTGARPSHEARLPAAHMHAGALNPQAYARFAERVKPFRQKLSARADILCATINGEVEGVPSIRFDEPVKLEVDFVVREAVNHPAIAIYVIDSTGQLVIGTNTRHEAVDLRECELGKPYRIAFEFANRLRPGRFAFRVYLADDPMRPDASAEYLDYIDLASEFSSVAQEGPARWAWYSPPFSTVLAEI